MVLVMRMVLVRLSTNRLMLVWSSHRREVRKVRQQVSTRPRVLSSWSTVILHYTANAISPHLTAFVPCNAEIATHKGTSSPSHASSYTVHTPSATSYGRHAVLCSRS